MKKICKTKLPAMLLACMLLLSACGGQPASAGMAGPAASGSGPESVSAPESVSEPEQNEPEPAGSADWESEPGELRYLCSEGFDYAEEFYNGYAFAVRGLDCGYVDKDGNFTVSYQIDEDTWDWWFGEWGRVSSAEDLAEGRVGEYFGVSEEGLYPYCERMTINGYENGFWGYKDIRSGEIVIPAQYQNPTPFREGRAVVEELREGYSEGRSIIDTDGNELFSIRKDFQGYFAGGMLHVCLWDDNDNCMVDRDGNLLIDFYYNAEAGGATLYHTLDVSGGGCRNDLAWDTEHILAWDYDDQRQGSLFYINNRGERTLDLPADAVDATVFRGGIAGYRNEEGLWGLINCYGEVLTPPVYEDFGNFGYNGDAAVLDENDYSWVQENGEYYVVNTRIEKVDGEAYEWLATYCDGLMGACKDGQYGYIKPGEGVVIDFAYDGVGRFENGIACAMKEDDMFYIDKNGGRLAGAYTDQYYTCEENTWLAFHESAEHPFNFVVRSDG